jgi:hypothetical protein
MRSRYQSLPAGNLGGEMDWTIESLQCNIMGPEEFQVEILAKRIATSNASARLRLLEKWLEEAEGEVSRQADCIDGWIKTWLNCRSAVLDELEEWMGRTSFSPYMKEVVMDKLNLMREEAKMEKPISEAADMTVDESVEDCSKPCHPNADCPICAEYWDRMRREGFWQDGKGWTEKGMKEMRR